jgi:hypothetical protein
LRARLILILVGMVILSTRWLPVPASVKAETLARWCD